MTPSDLPAKDRTRGRSSNVLCPWPFTKFSAILMSPLYVGSKEFLEARFAELAGHNFIGIADAVRQLKTDKEDAQISRNAIEYFRRTYGVTQEIFDEADRDRAMVFIRQLIDPDIGYLKARALAEPFFDVLQDPLSDAEGVRDFVNLGPRRRLKADHHILYADQLYRFHVRLWEAEGYFYLLNAEPDGNVFCLCPSAFGEPLIESPYKILPQDGEAAPVSDQHGLREVYGLITSAPLQTLGRLEGEPAALTRRQIGAMMRELHALGRQNWSARRYDYTVTF